MSHLIEKYPDAQMELRGCGMFWGLDIGQRGMAAEISKAAFDAGLLIELAGSDNNVLKFLPPLIIEEELLREGILIIDGCMNKYLNDRKELITGGSFDSPHS